MCPGKGKEGERMKVVVRKHALGGQHYKLKMALKKVFLDLAGSLRRA